MWLLSAAALCSWGELKIAPAVYTVPIEHKGILHTKALEMYPTLQIWRFTFVDLDL